jgi:hypothetical protein
MRRSFFCSPSISMIATLTTSKLDPTRLSLTVTQTLAWDRRPVAELDPRREDHAAAALCLWGRGFAAAAGAAPAYWLRFGADCFGSGCGAFAPALAMPQTS